MCVRVTAMVRVRVGEIGGEEERERLWWWRMWSGVE
jgi:hypothetical protein